MEWLTHLASAATVVSVVYIMFRGFKGDIDKRLDSILSEMKDMKTEIKEIRHDLTNIQVQIGKLETRVEERTLKVIHVERTGTQQDGK